MESSINGGCPKLDGGYEKIIDIEFIYPLKNSWWIYPSDVYRKHHLKDIIIVTSGALSIRVPRARSVISSRVFLELI